MEVHVANGEHNLEPFAHQKAHPQGRALTWEARQEVLALTRARVTPGRIVTALRQNHDALATAQDVYNLRHAERIRMLAGRSPLTALLDSLKANDCFSQVDPNHQRNHLLIIVPSTYEICLEYRAGCLWMTDTIYKTNRYELLPYHIVGVTATSCTFTFA